VSRHEAPADRWALRTAHTAAQLNAILRQLVDDRDRVVVAEVGGEWASRGGRSRIWGRCEWARGVRDDIHRRPAPPHRVAQRSAVLLFGACGIGRTALKPRRLASRAATARAHLSSARTRPPCCYTAVGWRPAPSCPPSSKPLHSAVTGWRWRLHAHVACFAVPSHPLGNRIFR
jgi:hypothetical protein